MSFGEAIISCFRKYATFSGRARRSEYWFFYLFNFLVLFGVSFISNLDTPRAYGNPGPIGIFAVSVLGLYLLAAFIPNLAVAVRRLHDTDHSGWWYLIALVPFVGAILLLVWYCTRGTDGPNNYGDDPTRSDASVFD